MEPGVGLRRPWATRKAESRAGGFFTSQGRCRPLVLLQEALGQWFPATRARRPSHCVWPLDRGQPANPFPRDGASAAVLRKQHHSGQTNLEAFELFAERTGSKLGTYGGRKKSDFRNKPIRQDHGEKDENFQASAATGSKKS